MKRRVLLFGLYALSVIVASLLVLDITCLCIAHGEDYAHPYGQYSIPIYAVEPDVMRIRHVKADTLNVRFAPDRNAEIVSTLEYADSVIVCMTCGDWSLVRKFDYQYPSGWVYNLYLQ